MTDMAVQLACCLGADLAHVEALTNALDAKLGHGCNVGVQQVAVLAKHEGEHWGPLVHRIKPDQTHIVLRLDLAHDGAFHLVLPQLDFDWLHVSSNNCTKNAWARFKMHQISVRSQSYIAHR